MLRPPQVQNLNLACLFRFSFPLTVFGRILLQLYAIGLPQNLPVSVTVLGGEARSTE